MTPPATDERRDTYDSRRIDGLVSSFARLEERVENLREIIRGQTAAARSLRNGIYTGCATAILIAVGEAALRSH